jgi:hypothetical protein
MGNPSYLTGASSAKGFKMSSLMPDSPQHQTTLSKPKKVGAPSGSVPPNKSPSYRPDLVGLQFGRVKIVSPEMVWQGEKWKRRMYVHCECQTCFSKYLINFSNLSRGIVGGCRKCNQPKVVTRKDVHRRVAAQHQRCTNPKNTRYQDYGGRGIEFRFSSVLDGYLWVMENLPPPENLKDYQLDRIDNEGHYEPGNLRWSTQSFNLSHTRRPMHHARLHAFRLANRDIHYADQTLKHLFSTGLTDEQIRERFFKPSFKPKGKYGTYLIPDPEIASLAKTSLSTTA